MMYNEEDLSDVVVPFLGEPLKFRLPKGDYITGKMIGELRLYEHDLLDALAGLNVPTDGTWVDVGACFGTHSAAFLRLGAAYVLAYEPQFHAASLAHLNMAQACKGDRSRFDVVAAAVHDSWRMTELRMTDPHNQGMTRCVGRGNRLTPSDVFAKCHRIDDDVEELNVPRPIRLIKVDVERLELDVLRSAQVSIERDRPVIVAEAQTVLERDAIDTFLATYGYHQRVGRVFGNTPTYIWMP